MKGLRLHIVWLLMALTVLPAVTSCYNYDEEDVSYSDASANYINVTISVSASDNAFTRAMPNGGEYGDETLKGDNRENEVKNITLIFYQDATGINTTSDESEVVSVQRYVVRPVTDSDKLTANDEHGHKVTEPGSDYYGKEVLYTTGNQKLEGTGLVKGETYKMLVVANASYVDVNVGDKIKTNGTNIGLRDKVIDNVFTGTGIGTNATDFVMVSETDAEVTLDEPDDIETTSNETSLIYYFPCIHIERLAARIDFDTTGGSYYENPADNTKSGYKYNMGGDIFVLTSVTPFNLYNENEYLFKRVQNAWPATATTYLGDETTEAHTTLTKVANNYVVDPHTAEKNNENSFTYLSPIAQYISTGNPYTYSMATQQTSPITICYAKENTLMPTSQLKQYATGIAFEGYYYHGTLADSNPEHRVYYHYIRHQGDKIETETYKAKQWNELSDDEVSANIPMNIGIVRNNIYRISIKGDGEGTLKVEVQETKWRHVDNPVIYI